MPDEDKKEFNAKFEFPALMAAKERDATYDGIEEEFIDKEVAVVEEENPDVSMT